jgi:Flp pilus assembly protein TadD
VALYWSTQFGKAKRELERVLRESPNQPEANYFLGSTLLSLRLSDEAPPYFERELELDPRCERCLSALAYLAYLARDDVRARSLLDRAVALNSTLPQIGVLYGMLAIRAEKYDEAIQYLSQVVEKSPKFAQAHFQLAIAYQRAGNAEKAKELVNIYKQLSATEGAQQPPLGQ